MSGSSNLNSFRDRGQVAVQLVSCGVLLPARMQRAIQFIIYKGKFDHLIFVRQLIWEKENTVFTQAVFLLKIDLVPVAFYSWWMNWFD